MTGIDPRVEVYNLDPAEKAGLAYHAGKAGSTSYFEYTPWAFCSMPIFKTMSSLTMLFPKQSNKMYGVRISIHNTTTRICVIFIVVFAIHF